MIYYKLYQNNNAMTSAKGKWYARAAVTNTVSLDELAEHMAAHNTPYSKGAIKGVLTDMVACIKELLLESKQVKIPDLVIFSPRISSTGALEPSAWSVGKNVSRVYVGARGTGELTGLKDECSLRELTKYDTGAQTTEP